MPGKIFAKIDTPENFSYSEYEFHGENGVNKRLDQHLHYTYSVFPSGKEVKSKIQMNFYQKPIYNYKLECELDPTRSMNSFISELDTRGALTIWIDMLDSYS